MQKQTTAPANWKSPNGKKLNQRYIDFVEDFEASAEIELSRNEKSILMHCLEAYTTALRNEMQRNINIALMQTSSEFKMTKN